MSYTALYRKFRPKTFEEVRGQDPIVTTLRNQIKNGRTSHAYLFTGTRGTGKTSIAKIFARAVNCENPKDGSPCCECAMCKAISDGSSLNVIELDAASNNGVDNIRQIIEEVQYSPAEGRFKVYIIDEVHMLSAGAFNALLKTLEEPPEYVIFILATTEVHKIPITILSRCQRYDFRRISIDTIAERLSELTEVEGIDIEDKALRYIAKTADGSMRDALSLLDQCAAFYFEQTLTYDKVLEVLGAVDTEIFSQILRAVIKSDAIGALRVLEEIVIQGRELGQFVTDLTWYLRNLILIKSGDGNEDVVDLSSENMARIREEAALIETEVAMRYIRILSDLSNQLRYATGKRVLVEIALIKLCKPSMENDYDSLIDRIRQLEEKMENGIPTFVQAPVSAKGTGETVKPKEQAPLPKALPDDIKEIASKWGYVLGNIDDTTVKFLQGSYPSIEGDDILAIVVDEYYSYQRFSEDYRLKELKDNISNIMGKEIKVVVRYAHDEEKEGAYPDVRAMVDEKIDFEIDEIEDEDGDEEEFFENSEIERD